MVFLREAKFMKRYWAIVQICRASFSQLHVSPKQKFHLFTKRMPLQRKTFRSSLPRSNKEPIIHHTYLFLSLVLFLTEPSPPPHPAHPVAGWNRSSMYRSGFPGLFPSVPVLAAAVPAVREEQHPMGRSSAPPRH
jgi:hypothetical protein